MNSPVKYRSDIDGLRAFAVMSVVLFHFFPKILKGGFIGVDVFFVISGFLISSILFKEFEDNSFSLLSFYERRIKRIFPALIIVLTATLLVGGHLLFTSEYALLGKHAAGGAGFVSNLILWSEAGYFDAASENKPLLHLWSLGIEEQFYIIWPLLLMASYHYLRSPIVMLCLLLTLSFALNIFLTDYDKTAAFYSPFSRFWELLLGAGLAYVILHREIFSHYRALRWLTGEDHQNERDWISVIGFGLLLVGIFHAREKDFPGFVALLPTLGAVLLLAAGHGAWVNRNLLSLRPAIWIGLISYPLYLWHWPLFVFANLAEGGELSVELRIGLFVTTFLLAWLTYILIEKPIRSGGHSRLKVIVLLVLMIMVGALGWVIYQGKAFSIFASHLHSTINEETIVRSERTIECTDVKYSYKKEDDWFCLFGTGAPEIFALGDSHVSHFTPALERYAQESGKTIAMTSSSGCPPLLGIETIRGSAWKEKHNCQELNERIFDYVVSHNIPNVLLAARWTYYTGSITKPDEINYLSMDTGKKNTREHSRASFEYGLKETVMRYRQVGVNVIFMADTPQQHKAPRDLLRPATIKEKPLNHFAVATEEHIRNQAEVNAQLNALQEENVVVIDISDASCNAVICPLTHEGKVLYHDDDHFSVSGALYVYPAFRTALKSAMK